MCFAIYEAFLTNFSRPEGCFQCLACAHFSCPCLSGCKLFLGLQPGSRADTPPEEGLSRRHFGQDKIAACKEFFGNGVSTGRSQCAVSVPHIFSTRGAFNFESIGECLCLTKFDYPGKVCFTLLSGTSFTSRSGCCGAEEEEEGENLRTSSPGSAVGLSSRMISARTQRV